MAFDNVCKYLSETYPARFATWLLGENPETVEVLKTELSIEPIRADFVTFLRTQEQILHLEFQVEVASEPPLPLRMLDYWVRLYRRYRVPITQVIVFLKQTSAAAAWEEEFRVGETRHRYRVLRMWEQEPDLFLQEPALLPLASLCRTEAPEQLLNQVAQEVNNIEVSQGRGAIAACTEVLAGLRFDDELIQRLFREDIVRESVVYQRILREGREEGIQQGLQEGIKTSILTALAVRFGSVPELVSQQLGLLRIEQLQGLLRQAVSCETMEEFINQVGFQQGLQEAIERLQPSFRTSILDALEARFGSVPPEVAEQLEGLTPEQLQGLLRQAVTCETLEEFISQLESMGSRSQ
jgi:predicted transposase/invertase (TIGR01784 family)